MKLLNRLCCLIIISLQIFSCNAQKKTVIDANEFEKGIASKDSIQLLDVRTPGEYNTGHIKSALLADWRDEKEFNRRISFIDKKKPVYVYCLSGGRSGEAARTMRNNGYEQVYELQGGMNAWKAAEKPIEGNPGAKEMTIATLDSLIHSSKIILVDFGAEWCPPCKKMEPVLKSLENDNHGKFSLVKVDGGRDQSLVQQYKVTALPVFIIFKEGKQVWRKDGIADEKELRQQLQ